MQSAALNTPLAVFLNAEDLSDYSSGIYCPTVVLHLPSFPRLIFTSAILMTVITLYFLQAWTYLPMPTLLRTLGVVLGASLATSDFAVVRMSVVLAMRLLIQRVAILTKNPPVL